MTCPEQPVVAFLSGELSEEEERRFDDHLLACEPCWRAVQADRAARLALERLREPAPVGLQGRITLSVALASPDAAPCRGFRGPRRRTGTGRSTRGRLVAAVAGLLLVATGGALGWLLTGRGASDPPQVAAVVAMLPHAAQPSSPLRSGERLMIASQPVTVHSYVLDGVDALVATSTRPFPVPAASHMLSGSSAHAWMATRGALSIYGVNRRRGGPSMFLVAAMPMAELPEFAARLKLIS